MFKGFREFIMRGNVLDIPAGELQIAAAASSQLVLANPAVRDRIGSVLKRQQTPCRR